MNPIKKDSLEDAFKHFANESHFQPHFAERLQARLAVLREVRTNPFDIFASELSALFRRVVIAGTVVITLLSAYNLSASGEWSVSAVFGVAQLADMHEGSIDWMLSDE